METENSTKNNNPHKNKVHRILAHSYLVQFVLFLIGIYLDFVFKLKIPTDPMMVPAGIVILVFGSLLIFWAQKTSRDLKTENLSKETFYHGPYCYTRSPTHWGLFFLMFGFGIMINVPFVILFAVISFIIAKLIFLDQEEKILAEKYGTPYLEYKKMVRF